MLDGLCEHIRVDACEDTDEKEKRKYLMLENELNIIGCFRNFAYYINRKKLNVEFVFVSSYEDAVNFLKQECFDGIVIEYFYKDKSPWLNERAIGIDEMSELSELAGNNAVVIVPRLSMLNDASEMYKRGIAVLSDGDARMSVLLSLLKRKEAERKWIYR